MTAHTRKFYLYPEKVVPRETIALEADRLEKEIRNLLRDKSIPPDKKVLLLETLINTKKSLRDIQGNDRNIVIENVTEEPSDTTTTQIPDDTQSVTEVQSNVDHLMEPIEEQPEQQTETEEGIQIDVLHYIDQFHTEPYKYRSARHILTQLLETGKFDVSPSEEIVIDGKEIEGSSINEIIRDLVTAKKYYTQPPAGVRELMNFIKTFKLDNVVDAIRNQWRIDERIKRRLSESTSSLQGKGSFFVKYRERKR